MPAQYQMTRGLSPQVGPGPAMGWERDVHLSEAAHDLANLLQILSSSLNLMRREIERPELVRARLATAMSGVSQCMSLSRTLFASGPVEADGAVLLQSVIESHRPLFELAAGPDIDLEVRSPADPLWIHIDRTRLERALLNLVINAAQAVDGPGHIRVTCHAEDDQALLSVEDDGPGFTVQTTAHARDRRFTTKACGSGLGLASVDALARSAGGEVTLDRSDLGGACVRMTLPRRRPVDAFERTTS
jgi:signal transduction histidine kinase